MLNIEYASTKLFSELKRPLVSIDLEGTELNTRSAKIISVGLKKTWPDGLTEERSILCNPQIPIPPEATAIHGIHDSSVAHLPPFAHFASELEDYLESCDLTGFNILRYDLPLLTLEFKRCGISFDTSTRKVIDTYILFAKVSPRDLSAAYKSLTGTELAGHHDALCDAVASETILKRILLNYPLFDMPIESLYEQIHPKPIGAMDTQGRFLESPDGPIFNFGKYSGDLASAHLDYVQWMITRGDFESDVKLICIAIIEKSKMKDKIGFVK